VATGGVYKENTLVSEDVLKIIKNTGLEESLDLMNPVINEIPAAPLIASNLSGKPVSLAKIMSAFEILNKKYESLVVEGIGGILVPITKDCQVIDLIKEFKLPVVIVTRAILGTINHTALTAKVLKDAGIPVIGIMVSHTCDVNPGTPVTSSFEVIKNMTGLPIIKEFKYEKTWNE
ncbi:MAG: Dethiobiotin synthetase, partial [uncultured bacterium]